MQEQPAPSPLLTKNREHLLAQQLQLERRQLERLKHDFTYNLQLLKERDAELEQYDVEVSALRTELEQRDARARETKRLAEESAAKLTRVDDRVASLEAANTESEAQKADLREQLGRRVAEATRLQEEVDELRKARTELQAGLAQAQRLATEQAQEVALVRSELSSRLAAAEKELVESEATWRGAVAQERAQQEERLKSLRTSTQKHADALQEQVEELQSQLAARQQVRCPPIPPYLQRSLLLTFSGHSLPSRARLASAITLAHGASQGLDEATEDLRQAREALAAENGRNQRARTELQRRVGECEELQASLPTWVVTSITPALRLLRLQATLSHMHRYDRYACVTSVTPALVGAFLLRAAAAHCPLRIICRPLPAA